MITNESIYTQEECLISAMSQYKKRIPLFIIVISLGLLVVISSIILLIATNNPDMGLLLALGVFIVALGAIMLIYLPKRVKKGNMIFKNGVKYLYSFEENKFSVACKMDKSVSKQEFTYDQIVKKDVTKDEIRIFPNKYNFYPLKLSSFKSEEDKNKVFKYLKIEEAN